MITREAHLGFTSVAFSAAGAARVDANEFRRIDGDGDLGCPLEGRNSEVWKLPPLQAQKKGRHDWPLGVKLGPDSDGPVAQKADTVLGVLSGVRNT